ncbi:MAG: DUF6587 family protein [Luteimonas sp.]
MDVSLAIQYVLIALALVFSAWVVMKKQLPGVTRKLRIALAVPLVREGRPTWLRALGRRIAPAGAGNAKDCGGCNNCGPDGP